MTPAEIARMVGAHDGAPTVAESREMVRALAAELTKRNKEVAEIIEIAHKHGWNGVDNSKILSVFIDGELEQLEEVTAKLKDVTKDRDKIAKWSVQAIDTIEAVTRERDRYKAALGRIGYEDCDECAKAYQAREALRGAGQ